MNTQHHKDEELWQIAKARVAFRWSLACYFIINAMLVTIWFMSMGPGHYFWPVWPMMGWGVGIAFQYFHAYHGNRFVSATDEYEKLKKQQDPNY